MKIENQRLFFYHIFIILTPNLVWVFEILTARLYTNDTMCDVVLFVNRDNKKE